MRQIVSLQTRLWCLLVSTWSRPRCLEGFRIFRVWDGRVSVSVLCLLLTMTGIYCLNYKLYFKMHHLWNLSEGLLSTWIRDFPPRGSKRQLNLASLHHFLKWNTHSSPEIYWSASTICPRSDICMHLTHAFKTNSHQKLWMLTIRLTIIVYIV